MYLLLNAVTNLQIYWAIYGTNCSMRKIILSRKIKRKFQTCEQTDCSALVVIAIVIIITTDHSRSIWKLFLKPLKLWNWWSIPCTDRYGHTALTHCVWMASSNSRFCWPSFPVRVDICIRVGDCLQSCLFGTEIYCSFSSWKII